VARVRAYLALIHRRLHVAVHVLDGSSMVMMWYGVVCG
jgi:hypothetical protein